MVSAVIILTFILSQVAGMYISEYISSNYRLSPHQVMMCFYGISFVCLFVWVLGIGMALD